MDSDHPSRLSAHLSAAAAVSEVAIRARAASAPPVARASMVARPWRGFLRGLADALVGLRAQLRAWVTFEPGAPAAGRPVRMAWERAARRRRYFLLAVVALSTAVATQALASLLPFAAYPLLRTVQISLFAVLFAWVAAGFTTALMGFWVLWRGDRHALSAAAAGSGAIDAAARTAIIMPICNEQVSTVFAGLRATWESLAETGQAGAFDLYVLSDTSDPAVRAAEYAAWAQLRRDCAGGERIHYRWRQRRTKRKAGNVADFCRRWGANYRYMVVLDADSVMTGDALVRMVRLMEADPRAGIIQSAPQTCGLTTTHARSQQFAARVAGRLFTAGMQYWQLGESHYWGHNAILRVAPFMEHCALAPIHGRGGLAGEILSHDFVEAALMRRAGFSVWVVGDLEGSYEQQPPNLIEELQRDRRWCQGNLQNARLITEPGLHGVHRAMLLTGTMAYVSAPLWLAFVLVSALLGVLDDAPVRAAGQALSLFAISLATLAMLMLPRAMGVLAILLRREQTTYGGARSLLRGVLLEAGLSVLQSPVRMMAHTLFVVVALTGLKLDWKSPPREAEDLPWLDALQRFAAIDLVVLACFTMALALHSRVALWLMPVAVPLLLAVPLAVYTSRASLGERLRARGLLLTPEELATPAVLTQAWAHAAQAEPARPLPAYTPNDPWLLELVRWAVGRRAIQGVSGGHAQRLLSRGLLVDHATARAIAADLRQLLNEPQGVKRLLG